MYVNGMNRNPKGIPETAGHAVSRDEKIGLAFGAVAFILVLVFFLVLGNMSHVPAPESAPQAPSAPVAVIQPESSALGFGDMLMMVGGVALLVGFWVVANRLGWLSIEAVSDASEASAEVVAPVPQGHSDDLPPLSEIYQEIKSLTLDLARREQEVQRLRLDLAAKDESLATLKEQLAGQTAKASELSRELSRRHQTIQRLSEERHQIGEELQALHSLLDVEKGNSLAEKVEQLKLQLMAALTTKEELSLEVERLRQEPQFDEVKGEELRKFWLTVKLDGKPFMSRRRLERLYARMRVDNIIWVRKVKKAEEA